MKMYKTLVIELEPTTLDVKDVYVRIDDEDIILSK